MLLSTVVNKSDGTFNLDELEKKIRLNPDVHEPFSNLCIFENTHNICGGRVKDFNIRQSLSQILIH